MLLRLLRGLRGASAAAPKVDLSEALGLRDQGRGDQAAALVRSALEHDPRSVDALLLLADLQREAGGHDEALATIARARSIAPESADVRLVHAAVLRDRGDRDAAASLLREAVERAPEAFDPLVALGEVLVETGDARSAIPVLQRANALGPDSVRVLNLLGMALGSSGRAAEAHDAFARAAALAPDDLASSSNLASVLRELGRPDEARARLERVLERHPGSVAARLNLALVHREAGRVEPARDLLAALESEAPEDADVVANHAKVLDDLGRHAEARARFERAVALAPRSADLRLSLALHRLASREFGTAWDDYEARYDSHESPRRPFAFPEWRGEPLAGKRVLAYAEQGIGDEIMFAGCVPDLAAEASSVVLECDPRLASLFRRSFPGVEVVPGRRAEAMAALDGVRACDVQLGVGSLPRRYRRDAAAFPDRASYLVADPALVTKARAAFSGRPTLGIAWRGGISKTRSAVRSVPVDLLASLMAEAGAEWVSLQHDAKPEELDRLRAAGARVTHEASAFEDFDRLAALACALDGVVTVCSSIVHVCGALGVPALVLAPATPEWRYMFEGERMPWYRSVRLLRQASIGDWSSVIVGARDTAREFTRGAVERSR